MRWLKRGVLSVAMCFGLVMPCVAGHEEMKVLFIPKGANVTFWDLVVEGAEQEAKKQGVKLVVRSPLVDGDVSSQAGILDFALTQPFKAVVLAPTDSKVLQPKVKALCEAGMRVLVIDSPMNEPCLLTNIATDNHAAGMAAAHYLAHEMGEKGEVLLAQMRQGVTSTDARHEGFIEGLGHYANMKITLHPYFEEYDVGSVRSHSLESVKAVTDGLGLFAVNESITAGIYLSMRQHSKAKNTIFVGFDDSPLLRKAVREGHIQALIVQSPAQMGALGVRHAVAAIHDEEIPHRVDVPFAVMVANMPKGGVFKLPVGDVAAVSAEETDSP